MISEKANSRILPVKLFTLEIVGLIRSKIDIYLRAHRKDLENKTRAKHQPGHQRFCIERLPEISIGGKEKTEAVVSEILADDGSMSRFILDDS